MISIRKAGMMYNLKGIEDDERVKSIKELVAEFQTALFNKNAPYPVRIKIWKNSDNLYEPTISHFFKASGSELYDNPTFGTSKTPEGALQVAISFGLSFHGEKDTDLESEENLFF